MDGPLHYDGRLFYVGEIPHTPINFTFPLDMSIYSDCVVFNDGLGTVSDEELRLAVIDTLESDPRWVGCGGDIRE